MCLTLYYNMKIKTILTIFAIALVAAGCGNEKKAPKDDNEPISTSVNAKGDKTVYGLACDGCSDSVIVLLPNAGGDPISYNIIEARRKGKVFGTPRIGDWLGVIVNEKDHKKAALVVDLDEVKGTWTYQVMPKLKDINKLTRKEVRNILANMDDSIKETYMIPREYGFTLSRQSQAMSVGQLHQASDYDDESPVEYPELKQYSEWHAYNGKLILIQGTNSLVTAKKEKVVRDTFEFVYLKDDSLVLSYKGAITSYHRASDATKVNAKAQAAAKKQQQQKAQEELK